MKPEIVSKAKVAAPEHHSGTFYQTFLETLTNARRVNNYLEIGVQTGQLLSKINAKHAYAVDPFFNISNNVAANKQSITLHHETSDEFFATWTGPADGKKIDFAFLDGMHLFEYLLRDFYNTERMSHASALISMHDCMPLNEFMADRNESRAIERGAGSAYPSAWTGDVWKVIPILKKYRPDLSVICVNAAPTGLVFVTNLNPSDTSLQDSYMDIVKEFASVANDRAAIDDFYKSIEIVDAENILNGFDHSLYFKV